LRDLEARGKCVTPESSRDDAEVLHERLTRDAKILKEELDPPIDRVWADEMESVYADLKGILHKMAADSPSWQAHRAEWGFGLSEPEGADPRSSAEPAILFDRYLVRGQIDLVERDPSTDRLRITDLKTGADDIDQRWGRERPQTPADGVGIKPFFVIGGGEMLQPVLYSLAFEAIARQEVAQARLFYASTKAGFSEHLVPIHEEARRRGREVLEIVDRAVEKAFFAPLPRVGACEHCSYRAVCGPDAEARAKQKDHQRSGDPGAIDDLFELRRRP
jgi:ATP-dependent helicase/nuclease subunit B